MEIMKEITVADIMTRNPLTVSPETSLLDCAKKMLKNKLVGFPIVQKEKLIGFITQRDILWALIKLKEINDLRKIKAIGVSPRKLVTVSPNMPIEKAIKKMKKYYRLPVVINEKLVGIIAAADILLFNPEFYPEFEELSKIREESEKLKRLKKIGYKTSQGYCEECGNYDSLSKSGKGLVCDECREK